jgi:hypothetical protein
MNKTLLVLRHEIITILSRPSFLFALFGIPVIAALVFTIAGRLSQGSPISTILSRLLSNPQTVKVEGYIDQSGIIKEVPASVPAGSLVAFPDEGSATLAMENGDISAYYIIPPGYIQSGLIIYNRPDYNPMGQSDQSGS